MCDEGLTVEEAHKNFAIGYNGEVWGLLEKENRSAEEDRMMLMLAHASCLHWKSVGGDVNQQRGEWMISRVNSVLGYSEAALRHAENCLRITDEHPEEMADFDRAFALEAMARAYALAGDRLRAEEFIGKAEKAGEVISDPEDRKIFQGDFKGGDWYGIR